MSMDADFFFLKTDVSHSAHKIHPQSGVLFLGSCFSENIGSRLRQLCFDTWVNPTGTLFHPGSIESHIRWALEDRSIDQRHGVIRDDIHYHLDFHSHIFDVDRASLFHRLDLQLGYLACALARCSFVFVTLGTAWVFKNIETQKIVANCHKQPSDRFEKKLLKEEEILSSLRHIVHMIHAANPTAQVVFTISPVRHTRNGLWENNVSKGRLQSAVYSVVQERAGVQYFPSYEYIIDVLRDYRFFKTDRIHPSEESIDVLFHIFGDTFFDDITKEYAKEMSDFLKLMAHRSISDTLPVVHGHQLRVDARRSLLLESFQDLWEARFFGGPLCNQEGKDYFGKI